ncbi:MAG TPA: nucleotide disphospho-sugar-binding domain-containing protein [Opitutaceae bacterium]|nr:nucleotide disphospho-sugar-binding domain-containing protein [Opitutaceae bacterium]
MARVVIATFGSLGDLHPAIALAYGLQARGHQAEIATSEPYRAKIAALGLPFHAVRPDLSLSNRELAKRVMNGWRSSKVLMREFVFPFVRETFEDLDRACAGADLLVASELAYVAPIVAARQRMPWVFFGLSPVSFFSVFDPSHLPGPPGSRWIPRLGPGVNRWFRGAAKRASHRWWKPLRTLRREHGLPAGHSPLFEGKYSPHLNLALFSRELQPPPRDWPPHILQTGFCFFDESDSTDASAALPTEVEAFLASGPPPIVFTLGSAAVEFAGDFYTESARAAEKLGRRALLLLGRNSPPPRLPPSMLAWNYLPFARIFPRVAAIVHQGGIGTTAQSLRAGRPMLVVPFAHDQFDNAARIRRLGFGRTLPRRRYRATAVAAELAALLADESCARRTAETATRLRAEDGIATACTALESLLPASARVIGVT